MVWVEVCCWFVAAEGASAAYARWRECDIHRRGYVACFCNAGVGAVCLLVLAAMALTVADEKFLELVAAADRMASFRQAEHSWLTARPEADIVDGRIVSIVLVVASFAFRFVSSFLLLLELGVSQILPVKLNISLLFQVRVL